MAQVIVVRKLMVLVYYFLTKNGLIQNKAGQHQKKVDRYGYCTKYKTCLAQICIRVIRSKLKLLPKFCLKLFCIAQVVQLIAVCIGGTLHLICGNRERCSTQVLNGSFIPPPFVHSTLQKHLCKFVELGAILVPFKLVGLGLRGFHSALGSCLADNVSAIGHRNGSRR